MKQFTQKEKSRIIEMANDYPETETLIASLKKQTMTADEIDLAFNDAKAKHFQVPVRQLRKCSYACLIYEWLRCGYAHQYCPHENITEVPASRKQAQVSYIGRGTPSGLKRMASFHLDYLMKLAQYHVSALPTTPLPAPNPWWLDQG